MPLPVLLPLRAALLAAAVGSALPAAAQMPSPTELEEAMRKMREQMDKLTPEQRKMLDQTQRQLAAQPTVGSGDDVGVPRRDAARIAKVPRAPLTGAQLKSHVEALQPKLAQALSAAARRRAQAIERALQQQGGDVAAKLAATANGLAVWGAWPEATYLMGKAARMSGSAQDLNNLAAFLTMQKAGHAALPILITLDARYPNNATILNNLGQAWFELGELKEAERALRLALARVPNHPQANVTQSHIEEARGDRAAAQASMRRAIAGGYSEGKAQRFERLGGRLTKDDLRWTMKLPADALGLSKFVPPPYAMKLSDLWLLPPSWQSFREEVEALRDKYKAQGVALAAQAPWLADAALRGPLTAKASRMSQLSGDDWMRRRNAAHEAFADAIRFEQQERKTLEGRLAAIHAEGKQKYRNVPGGYQYDYACPQIRAAITQYLEATGKRLDEARRGLLDYQRQTTNERAYYAQFMQSQRSFEYTVVQAKVEFLNVLRGLALVNDGPGLLHQFGNSCLKPDRPGKSGGKLADFDEINCQHIVSFTVPGVGRIDVRCNRMETKLEPLGLDFEAGWTEDLIKDRVLAASVEIEIEGVTVGARGEFDDLGLKGGQVTAGIDVDAGPLEGRFDAVTIEFDRTGVTDVRSQAEIRLGDKSVMSWNAGTSANASGGFDSKSF